MREIVSLIFFRTHLQALEVFLNQNTKRSSGADGLVVFDSHLIGAEPRLNQGFGEPDENFSALNKCGYPGDKIRGFKRVSENIVGR